MIGPIVHWETVHGHAYGAIMALVVAHLMRSQKAKADLLAILIAA